MIGRLDRYVARSVIGSYLAGLVFMALLFTLINLLLDLSGFLQKAQERGVGAVGLLADMARYYLLSMPVVFVMVAPFVSVIAGMFAVARHMSANEVAPILFTGRGTVRILAPVLSMGMLSAIAMVGAWEFAVPAVNEPLDRARRTLENRTGPPEIENLVVKVREGADQTMFVASYDHDARVMHGVAVLDRGAGSGDTVLTRATAATWDEGVHDWRLTGGERRTEVRAEPREMLGMPDVEPDLLWRLGKEGRDSVRLSYSELEDLQALRPGRKDLVLAFHQHVTFPLANLVLLLLALPFAVHFERGGKVERVVFAVGLCAVYLVTDLTCQNLGQSLLHPVLAAWLPTILFGSVGVVMFGSIRT